MAKETGNVELYKSGNCVVVDAGDSVIITLAKNKAVKVTSEGKSILLATAKCPIPIEGSVGGATLSLNYFRPPMNDTERDACIAQAKNAAAAKAAKLS